MKAPGFIAALAVFALCSIVGNIAILRTFWGAGYSVSGYETMGGWWVAIAQAAMGVLFFSVWKERGSFWFARTAAQVLAIATLLGVFVGVIVLVRNEITGDFAATLGATLVYGWASVRAFRVS